MELSDIDYRLLEDHELYFISAFKPIEGEYNEDHTGSSNSSREEV